MSAEEAIEATRFRLFLRQFEEEWIEQHGSDRGWKAELARRLDVSPAYISFLAAGHRTVGIDTIEAARTRLRIHPTFFTDRAIVAPHYRDFLGSATVVERDSRNATHPAVEQYISEQATLGKPVTDEHAAQLRRMRFGDGGRGLTVHTVATIHRDMDDYERGLSKVVPLERAPDAEPSSPSKETPRYVPPRRRT